MLVRADVAQMVEQRHGKAQAVGSSPTIGSRIRLEWLNRLSHSSFAAFSGHFQI